MTIDFGSNIEPTKNDVKIQKAATGVTPEKKVRIILSENDEIPPTGLFIGYNGRSFMLMPGVEVDVPQGVVEVLDTAVLSKPTIDPQTQQVTGYREQHRFPYRVVRT